MKTYDHLHRASAPNPRSRSFIGNATGIPSAVGKKLAIVIPCLLALFVIAECASADITQREVLVNGPLPRPGQIWVYNFAASPSEVPANSALAGQPDLDTTPQTEQQIAEGRKLGAEIASELVQRIHDLGMPAAQATADMRPQVNDIEIRGYLISIKKGSAKKRFGIGFGAGASELKTAVEGFQMTTNGLRKLGFGIVESKSRKTPGASAGVAGLLITHNPAGLIISSGMKVYGEKSGKSTLEGRARQTAKEIADVLKQRFKKQGWIN